MLSSVSAKVSMKGEMGQKFDCRVGLRQGSVISPSLATAFLDKITDHLEETCCGINFTGDRKITHLFYADDFVVFTPDAESLQHTLNSLSQFCMKIGLKVNTEKTFWVVFNKCKPKGLKDILWEGRPLAQVDTIVYLGGSISFKGSFAPHIDKCKQKANRAFSLLLNFQKRFPQLKFSRFLQLYFSLVYPCLTYASEIFVWGEYEVFNTVFLKHLRQYLGLPKSVSGCAIHYLTGTKPIFGKIWKRCYRFWMTMAGLDSNRLEATALNNFREMGQKFRKSWYSEMQKCFSLVGFDGDFVNWSYAQIKKNQSRFNDKVDEYLNRKVQIQVEKSSYSFLVKNHNGSTVDFLENAFFQNRRTLSRVVLRCCCFDSITGSWHSIHPKARLCSRCTGSFHTEVAIGDETHYIESCPYFSVQRKLLCDSLSCSPSELSQYVFGTFSGTNTRTSTLAVYSKIARFMKCFVRLSDSYKP